MSEYSIPFGLTNVSDIAISDISADKTLTVGGTMAQSRWAGVGVFARGKPFKPLAVSQSNYQALLGAPIKPTAGSSFEPYRHMEEAVLETDGTVVRVVAADAKYPVIAFSDGTGAPGGAVAVDYSANLYGVTPELASSEFLQIYVDDGDPCDTISRQISFTKLPALSDNLERWKLTLEQTTAAGLTTVLETHTISFALEGVNDMGQSCFIDTALESRSNYLRSVCDPEAAGKVRFAEIKGLVFKNGTNGSQNKISDEQYLKAVAVLNNANVNYTAVLGLGCYSKAAIEQLAEIARDRRIDAFLDIKPTLTYAEALKEATDSPLLGTRYTSVCLYHFPYTHKDKWTGSRVAVGLSGVAYAAKAKGIAKVSDVGGWHYSPAGEERGIINRAAVDLIENSGTPDYDAMYTARINKVAVGSSGKMIIDDALTTYSAENYLRFQHVSSVMNAISRYYFQLSKQLKHQPDGLTDSGLTKGTIKIMDRFVASGALVRPRNPDMDGTKPYVVKVSQLEMDLWKTEWACCVTGSARRIAGEPSLIK